MATGSWGGSGDTRVFRVNVLFKKALQNCQTGFHIRDVGVNTLDPEDVADEAFTWATTQFIKTLHLVDDLIGVDVTNLATKEGFSKSASGVHGTNTGEAAPSFLMVPVSLKGSIRRRYGNGRMLWPVSSELFIAQNVLHPDGVTVFQTVIDDFVSRFMEGPLFGTMRLVHLHGPLAPLGARPAVPATWYDITSVRLNTSLSSLRRRKVGVGS